MLGRSITVNAAVSSVLTNAVEDHAAVGLLAALGGRPASEVRLEVGFEVCFEHA